MSNNNALDVIVFGNNAVGKTSLLSSMYLQMEKDGFTSFRTASGKIMTFSTMRNEDFCIMKNKWLELQKQLETGEFGTPPVLPYEGTMDTIDFPFCFKTQKRECQINFVDTKGGHTGNIDDRLINRLNNSLLAICVVDAAILMEQSTAINLEKNAPMSIKKLLEKVLDDGDNKQPMTCLFVLTKCEKWLKTQNDQNALVKRFEEIFKPVLLYAEVKQFPIYYLPVQTIGCVEFSRIDPITKEMKFRTISNNFQPVDVIFPLAFVIKCLLNRYETAQKSSWWITQFISWLFSWKEDFSEYYSVLKKNAGNPVDFRWNNNGTSTNLIKTSFWN